MAQKIFLTGKLALSSLKQLLSNLELDFNYEIIALNITVAALMSPEFIVKKLMAKLDLDQDYEIIIPGRVQGDLDIIKEKLSKGSSIYRGPKDLRDLASFLGYDSQELKLKQLKRESLILAEIVDASLLSWSEIYRQAKYYQKQGADIIDLGLSPNTDFPKLEEVIKKLKKAGFKVSLDSLERDKIKRAAKAGIDLLLSLNSTNADLVKEGDFKPVIIPDHEGGVKSLKYNIKLVESYGCQDYIIDPILDPINFGFSKSLARYKKLRDEFPQQEILMGIGNLTELTDADSTGINALLAGVATELEIDYFLTTEVAFRAKGAVKELDLALKMMEHAKENNILPKNLAKDLVTIKDRDSEYYTRKELQDLFAKIKDRNYRIFIDGEQIYAFNAEQFVEGSTPEEVFEQIEIDDPDYAFYFGCELQKAYEALITNKEYYQDDQLSWGYLSR